MATKKAKDKKAFDRLVKKLEKNAERAQKEREEKKNWEHPGARDPGNVRTYYS